MLAANTVIPMLKPLATAVPGVNTETTPVPSAAKVLIIPDVMPP